MELKVDGFDELLLGGNTTDSPSSTPTDDPLLRLSSPHNSSPLPSTPSSYVETRQLSFDLRSHQSSRHMNKNVKKK
ncbi:Protein CBG25313 [Caenorhabditis briggsae]|uniref:Protein CBG25313 n=1 Tax=Caenorhabditis briggsae TaxID=6238 RepID=B6IH11_CAEBR|nr:Protein CBG25313 [Caenorhabditis briggsae]CAR99191.1 Protein CBG25313 [Caenorhabditis briggsae]